MNPNPFDDQVHFDSCAFNGGTNEDIEAAKQVIKIFKSTRHRIILPHSVATEMKNLRAPEWKRNIAEYSMQTAVIPLTPQEESQLNRIEQIMLGGSTSPKRKPDCMHVFEAQKYGRYFVSSDEHIYPYAKELLEEFDLYVVRPIEFLKILNFYNSET